MTYFMTPKGHGDLCGRFDLVYEPKRSRGRRDLLYDPKVIVTFMDSLT